MSSHSHRVESFSSHHGWECPGYISHSHLTSLPPLHMVVQLLDKCLFPGIYHFQKQLAIFASPGYYLPRFLDLSAEVPLALTIVSYPTTIELFHCQPSRRQLRTRRNHNTKPVPRSQGYTQVGARKYFGPSYRERETRLFSVVNIRGRSK